MSVSYVYVLVATEFAKVLRMSSSMMFCLGSYWKQLFALSIHLESDVHAVSAVFLANLHPWSRFCDECISHVTQ